MVLICMKYEVILNIYCELSIPNANVKCNMHLNLNASFPMYNFDQYA